MGDKLLNVKADTATDYLDAAHKAMGDDVKLGETSYDVQWKFTTGADGKITKATATLTTEIKRTHWAGPAKTKPDKANAEAIAKIEALNKAHEEAHRKGYEGAFAKNKDALEKEMVGKTQKEAEDVVEKMHQALLGACETLHKSGGKITVTDSGGKITVKEGAEGSGGCT